MYAFFQCKNGSNSLKAVFGALVLVFVQALLLQFFVVKFCEFVLRFEQYLHISDNWTFIAKSTQ